MQRFQWKVLTQSMANSPTICQAGVSQAIMPICQSHPEAYIIHSMDDILISHANKETLYQIYGSFQENLTKAWLAIAPEKVQETSSFSYLGTIITQRLIKPQKIQIRTSHLKTLNDFQKHLGDINWIRPFLRLTIGNLQPLFNVLQGEPSPTSPQSLTSEAKVALLKVEQAI